MVQAQLHSHPSINRIVSEPRTAHSILKGKQPRILSFGYSVGDEIATIRSVFPDADIFGCDINEPVLAAAQRTVGHLATIFLSNADNIAAHGAYDLIVASAVLCLNPPKDIQTLFPFATFDTLVRQLDAALSSGGLLMIQNASYRFQDTETFQTYNTVRSDLIQSAGFVDVFAPNGEVFLKQRRMIHFKWGRRGRAFRVKDDEELVDSLFQKSASGGGAVETLVLAAVPDTFIENYRYERSVLDILEEAPDEKLIIKTTRYRFGHDAATGIKGFEIKESWPSVVRHGRRHVRPEFWHPREDQVD